MQNKSLTISLITTLFLFFQRNVFAVSKIERMLKDHPVKSCFVIFGICAAFAGVSLLLNYYKTIFTGAMTLITGKRKTEESKIPTGKIGDISLPNARLILKEPEVENSDFIVTPRKEFWIGRDEDNQLILKGATVSRRHAKIRPGKEGYVLHDMSSRNGTYVNRKKIKGYILENGDLISIGSYTLIFNEEEKEGKDK